MKFKSLLFAALIAGMSLSANAKDLVYKLNGDVLTADDVTVTAGEYAVVKMNLVRQNSPDLTNIQFDIMYPEGVYPYFEDINDCSTWAAGDAGDDCTWKVGSGPLAKDTQVITFADNADVPGKYPTLTFVGANMTKNPSEKNPMNIYNLYIMPAKTCVNGTYELRAKVIKYTSYDDDTYWSFTGEEGEAEYCVVNHITVTGGVGAVNDLNVATAKTYKTIENGQVMIVKDGVKYNTMGQIVK